VPYIAFDYLGRVVTDVRSGVNGEFIPLANGGVGPAIDPVTARPALGGAAATVGEVPLGNSSNSFNLVHVDWLTGRGRLERREVR